MAIYLYASPCPLGMSGYGFIVDLFDLLSLRRPNSNAEKFRKSNAPSEEDVGLGVDKADVSYSRLSRGERKQMKKSPIYHHLSSCRGYQN